MPSFASAVTALAVAAAVPGVASASIIEITPEFQTINGKFVLSLFAKSDNANDVVLGISNVAGVSGLNYFDADFAGGSWSPQFTNPADVATDSYVTIGGTPGFANQIQPYPGGWGPQGFTQPTLPAGAGWFNAEPSNLQGKVDPITLQTLLGQFTLNDGFAAFPFLVGTVSFNQGLGTPTQFATVTVTPAPGALAVLGGAFLARGRRRR